MKRCLFCGESSNDVDYGDMGCKKSKSGAHMLVSSQIAASLPPVKGPIHKVIRLEEGAQARCGEEIQSPRHGRVKWDGVTCKGCLKEKP